MASAAALEAKLRAAFEPTVLTVEDESGGCGAKFTVTVVSTKFDGVPLLQRHRLVNEAVAQELKAIHAFSIKAMTPAQFAAKQAAAQ